MESNKLARSVQHDLLLNSFLTAADTRFQYISAPLPGRLFFCNQLHRLQSRIKEGKKKKNQNFLFSNFAF